MSSAQATRSVVAPKWRTWNYFVNPEKLVDVDSCTSAIQLYIGGVTKRAIDGGYQGVVVWDWSCDLQNGANVDWSHLYCPWEQGGCINTQNPHAGGAGIVCPSGFGQYNDGTEALCFQDDTYEIPTSNMGSCPACKAGPPPLKAGNPVNVGTGNKIQKEETDYVGSGPFPLRFERIYNSAPTDGPYFYLNFQTGLGTNWWHTYYRYLVNSNGLGRYVSAYRPDGSVFTFAYSGGGYVADPSINAKLERTASGWKLTNERDEVELYTSDGALQSITDRKGNMQTVTQYFQGSPVESALIPATPSSVFGSSGSTLVLELQPGDSVNPPTISAMIIDSAGNKQTFSLPMDFFSHLASSHLSPAVPKQVTDSSGRTLTFEADAYGRISALVLPDGGRVSYSYDRDVAQGDPAGSNLVQVTHPDGASRQYLYENSAYNYRCALTGIVDETGARLATYAYDPSGTARVTLTEHAGGAGRVALSYAALEGTGGHTQTSVTTYVDQNQAATRTYTFAIVRGKRVPLSITGPACPSCGAAAYTYDANGNVTSETDWNGNLTKYAYDLTRNLETSRTEGLTSAGATTPQTRTITTQWHPTLRLQTAVAEPLRITTYVFNGDGGANCGVQADGTTPVPGLLCSKSVQATTDANGSQGFAANAVGTPRVTSYTYNADGQVLTADGPRTDVADVTTYTYYAKDDPDLGKRGNVATITDALGNTTSITAYNANGQPTTIVDPNGLITALAYDARQRLLSRTVGGETTSYTYDSIGQLTQVTLPDGSYLAYTYDAAHRLIGIADALGDQTSYTLDLAGNRIKEDVYDPTGTLAQTHSRGYNELNRFKRDIGASGQTTAYSYDAQGNLTTITDPLNRVTSNSYDALNRLVQVTDPNSGMTRYSYNGLDALTSVTDPRSLTTSYTLDGLGDLTQQQSPDTGTTASSFDATGNVLTRTDAKGQVSTYTYDALNRVTGITYADGSQQSYVYDQGPNAIGRLSSLIETDAQNQPLTRMDYAYDSHGRVTSETRIVNGVAYTTGYSYDAAGRIAGLSYPSGRTLTYGFDAAGRVNEIITAKDGTSQVLVQNVQYQPFGGVKSYTLGNGLIYARSIDLDGRIAAYTLGDKSYSVAYDAASRITGIADASNAANANSYGYDTLDRLISAVLPSSNYGYSYDAVGNRLTKTVGTATDIYGYAASSNQLASISPASGSARSYLYDANGSTTSDGTNQYAYDARGRMVQSTGALGATNYQVNALGQRIRKTSASADTVYHYDRQGHLIAETDAAGGLKRELVYLGDLPIAVVQ